jgi:hypothetical protein
VRPQRGQASVSAGQGRQAAAAGTLPAGGAGALVDQQAAQRTLRSVLVSLNEPSGTFGVLLNGLGYPDRGSFLYQLRGLVGADGKPVPDLASAYSVDKSGPSPVMALNGAPTAMVTGARLRARLVLGNQWTGYRVAQTIEATTGFNGLARLRFTAGTRVEEATVDVEVLSNPFNPWFLPKIAGAAHLFYPSPNATGAVNPYKLEAMIVPAFSAMSHVQLGGARAADSDAADARRAKRMSDKIQGVAKRPSTTPKAKSAKVVGIE